MKDIMKMVKERDENGRVSTLGGEKMSNTEPPEHYERMVKEKPVLNPNLAEEMRTVKAEPAQHISSNPDTTAASCTLCGLTGSPKKIADHNCSLNPDDHGPFEERVKGRDAKQPVKGFSAPRSLQHWVEPNRFDPYEALDTIERMLEEKDGPKGVVTYRLPWDDATRIVNGLYALRAYITGMEK